MSTIREILRLAPTKGEVGVEVEVEGININFRGDDVWRREHDPSLKSEESAEYVLNSPLDRVAAKRAVRSLYVALREATINDSVRAGVHIHINVQEYTPTELATALTTYYLLEKVLTSYCGKGRSGNLFCLRLCDAELPLFRLSEAYQSKELGILNTDELRYAACNLKALGQYGSIEFRAMRTPAEAQRICSWIDMLSKVMESSRVYANPTEVLADISARGGEKFLYSVLGARLYAKLPKTSHDQEVRDMVDIVQVFAYSQSWEEKKANPNLNIFGTQPEEDW